MNGTLVGGHRLDFSAPPDDVSAVHEFLERVWVAEPAVGMEDRMALELAVIELASNVIEHAGGGNRVACSLDLQVAADGLRAHLVDDGERATVDPAAAELPDALAESGRGLALVRMLVDELRYERDAAGNHWTVSRGTRTEPTT